MYIDIEDEVAEAVADAVANLIAAGEDIASHEEVEELRFAVDQLRAEVETIRREQTEQNFWKADRNHSHE